MLFPLWIQSTLLCSLLEASSINKLVHSLVTHSLTHSCLVNLIDVALTCEDANSKLVEVVTVADVDAEDHVGNSLLRVLACEDANLKLVVVVTVADAVDHAGNSFLIGELTFGHKAKILFRL